MKNENAQHWLQIPLAGIPLQARLSLRFVYRHVESGESRSHNRKRVQPCTESQLLLHLPLTGLWSRTCRRHVEQLGMILLHLRLCCLHETQAVSASKGVLDSFMMSYVLIYALWLSVMLIK
jgi:hypothetical protein